MVNKIWSDLRKMAKPILSTLKADFKKETEESLIFDGLQRLVTHISGQNTENINRYTENMNTMVASLKESFQKTEVSSRLLWL